MMSDCLLLDLKLKVACLICKTLCITSGLHRSKYTKIALGILVGIGEQGVYLHKGFDKEENMYAYILAWLLLPERYLRDRLLMEDLILLNAIQKRIPTNWVATLKKHIIDTGINDEHNLPYGVFINKVLTLHRVFLTGETKLVYNKTNEIRKTILTCIGMKKTTDGWVFRDVQTQARNKVELSYSYENSISFTSGSEFERFIMNKFKRTSKRTWKLKKYVFRMEIKMDELIKNYVDSSSSVEGFDEGDE